MRDNPTGDARSEEGRGEGRSEVGCSQAQGEAEPTGRWVQAENPPRTKFSMPDNVVVITEYKSHHSIASSYCLAPIACLSEAEQQVVPGADLLRLRLWVALRSELSAVPEANSGRSHWLTPVLSLT